MRDLLAHLSQTAQPNVIGVEKSGAFVEHAHHIRDRMQQGQVLILNDAYIYKNILASGTADDAGRSYGASTYYGRKVIFKTRANAVHVLTIPTDTETADPQPRNFFGFEKSLQATDLLHCDMYDDALFPIALADSYVIHAGMQATDPSGRNNDQLSTTVGILPDNEHGLAAPGMKWIVNPPLDRVLAASMSLLRAEPG